ncbi:MAG TPA: hypothetical protein VM934_09395 [Pyrinomonadaceae bacterium]|nr:hypothetical protein [Pyrinomonadaceae bacterium]
MYGRFIKAQERRRATRDDNVRRVRPFEWGASFIDGGTNGDDDPRLVFERHTEEVLRSSAEFYAPAPVKDYQLAGDTLTWTSSVRTPSTENNTARARFFPAQGASKRRRGSDERRAVVVLPQWNAQADSHVALCRILSRVGISALRLTLPYHEERRPPELERADFLVSPNLGRTIQSMRQAVLDTRAAISWLEQQGFESIGIEGTSVGSCTAFLTFAHDERIRAGVFNHVSGYFSDVVWHGISTRHVRAGIEGELTLEELRRHWLPISPLSYAARLSELAPRPMRFIAARYDLTFPADLSREVISRVREMGVTLDVSWLPCGHYTIGEKPWVYLDGLKIVSFLRKHL